VTWLGLVRPSGIHAPVARLSPWLG
jgi:hypothetical protein